MKREEKRAEERKEEVHGREEKEKEEPREKPLPQKKKAGGGGGKKGEKEDEGAPMPFSKEMHKFFQELEKRLGNFMNSYPLDEGSKRSIHEIQQLIEKADKEQEKLSKEAKEKIQKVLGPIDFDKLPGAEEKETEKKEKKQGGENNQSLNDIKTDSQLVEFNKAVALLRSKCNIDNGGIAASQLARSSYSGLALAS